MDRAIFSPEEPLLLESFELIEKAIMSYGGDPSVGRKLWPILNEVGFRDILISSSWEQPETFQEWPNLYKGWMNVLDGKLGEIVIKNGWVDEEHLHNIKKAYLNLGHNKSGYAGSPWGEAVARK
ncbi:MAG: hypothetical protein GTN99_02435 [Candidatus Dadabacteria bacterium]|nr:hypothetical protein [Candidatus Dadabacteria bacterium]NIT13123.1 hypothetical protein [Candidatus Dadabacteria bacterium]